MSLDVRTIMLVFSALTLMFSGLLALARKYSRDVSGVGYWAIANLLFSCGFAFSYSFSTTSPSESAWPIILASILVAGGQALQYLGIQRFKGHPIHWQFALLTVATVLLSGIWFSAIHDDILSRAILNSVVFGIIFAACARELLIPAQSPLKIAYWVTGGSFALLSLCLFMRAVVLWQSADTSYGLFRNLPINPITFLVICLLQFATMFGFVLMLDYRLVDKLSRLAALDPLTGALNRRRLEEEAARLQARSARTGDSITVMMIDIDYFKQVNDRYGHQIGDEVLQYVAQTIQGAIRTDDYFARYGGEEFCILLPATTKDEAYALGERLRQVYADHPFPFDGPPLRSTLSIGIADSSDVGVEFRRLVQAADQALYAAKAAGRNLVRLHPVLEGAP